MSNSNDTDDSPGTDVQMLASYAAYISNTINADSIVNCSITDDLADNILKAFLSGPVDLSIVTKLQVLQIKDSTLRKTYLQYLTGRTDEIDNADSSIGINNARHDTLQTSVLDELAQLIVYAIISSLHILQLHNLVEDFLQALAPVSQASISASKKRSALPQDQQQLAKKPKVQQPLRFYCILCGNKRERTVDMRRHLISVHLVPRHLTQKGSRFFPGNPEFGPFDPVVHEHPTHPRDTLIVEGRLHNVPRDLRRRWALIEDRSGSLAADRYSVRKMAWDDKRYFGKTRNNEAEAGDLTDEELREDEVPDADPADNVLEDREVVIKTESDDETKEDEASQESRSSSSASDVKYETGSIPASIIGENGDFSGPSAQNNVPDPTSPDAFAQTGATNTSLPISSSDDDYSVTITSDEVKTIKDATIRQCRLIFQSALESEITSYLNDHGWSLDAATQAYSRVQDRKRSRSEGEP